MAARVTAENAVDVSVAMTEALDRALINHLDKGPLQEDLTFAYWRPSYGATRLTAILQHSVLPGRGDRELHGNVAFTEQYARRVLAGIPPGCGIALLHSHLGPGWQGMSRDDVVAERDRLAGAVWGRTGLPLLGLTWGTDGTWSARIWKRTAPHIFQRQDAGTVRVVGHGLRISYHPKFRIRGEVRKTQVATASVWGDAAQRDIARAHVGIAGLGSVGSVVAEGVARTGVSRPTFIDHDIIKERNLDRTLGAEPSDVIARTKKVHVATRNYYRSATAERLEVRAVAHSLLTEQGIGAALDCDAIVCCVDRPWPRYVLNLMAYAHLIPVIDGGIFAKVDQRGHLLHVDWRIHRAGPEQRCMLCLGALLRSDAELDREGLLDDPDYISGLSPQDRERYKGRNVFAFSLSVAAHEVIQLMGMLTRSPRIGGIEPQIYHAYPGSMHVLGSGSCDHDCDISGYTAMATDLRKLIETNKPARAA